MLQSLLTKEITALVLNSDSWPLALHTRIVLGTIFCPKVMGQWREDVSQIMTAFRGDLVKLVDGVRWKDIQENCRWQFINVELNVTLITIFAVLSYRPLEISQYFSKPLQNSIWVVTHFTRETSDLSSKLKYWVTKISRRVSIERNIQH